MPEPENPYPSTAAAPSHQTAAAAGASSVDLLVEDERWRAVDLDLVLACASAAAAHAGGDCALALSDDASVAVLNGQFRQKPKPTNVLSFPSGDPRMGLGDVILAFETMEREAAEQAVPLSHHASHLAVHGILHLAGYDHETDDAAAEMEALEARVLAAFGIADPYAVAAPSPAPADLPRKA